MYGDIWEKYTDEILLGSLAVVLVVVVIPIFGEVYGWWSSTVSRLIIASTGALGTIALVSVTAVTLLQNQQLVDERRIERERPLMKDMLYKVVWSALDTIERNQTRMNDRKFDWTDAYNGIDGYDNSEGANLDLEPITNIDDPIPLDKFKKDYSDKFSKMKKYDKCILELDKATHSVIYEAMKPVDEYLEDTEFSNVGGVPKNGGIVLKMYLSGGSQILRINRSWWERNKEDVSEIVEDVAGEEYERFRQAKKDFKEISDEVDESLIEVREEIEPQYGIYRNKDWE